MIDNNNFIRDILPSRDYAQYPQDFKNPLSSWIYEHPNTVKTAEIATGILGITTFGASVIGSGGLAAIAIAFAGIGATGVSALALSCLDLFVAPHHDMKNHVFTPASCEGGKLFYQGDVPVLTIDAETPFKAGWAQGTLLADQLKAVRSATSFVLNTLLKEPGAEDLPDVMAAIRRKIPQEYLEEMEGLVAGYNAKQQGWLTQGEKLTVDELILLNLMPDRLHFIPAGHQNYERNSYTQIAQAACTAILTKDEKLGPTFARNMDWPAFGIAGTYSLVINRKNKEKNLSTVEVGMPGVMGTLTGLNSAGLALAMNVCPGSSLSIEGMPSIFYNRLCLESCSSLEEADSFVNTTNPLGPYHLSIADQNDAKSFHFFQGEGNSHLKRNCTSEPLVTTNCNYNENGEMSAHMHYSEERHQILSKYFKDLENTVDPESYDPIEVASAALALPYVNNFVTTHTVIMQPRTGKMEVAFDNAWSGTRPHHQVDTDSLLHE